MRLGFGDLYAGCFINAILLIFAIFLTIAFRTPGFVMFIVLFSPVVFLNGRKILAKYTGPDISLWLYTNDIGVSFAYLSIGLFRQDKKFTKIEMDRLCDYFAAEFGSEVYNTIKAFVIKNKKQKIDLRTHTKKIVDLSLKNRHLFLHHLFSMALANGKYTPEEDLYLRRIARLIKISNKNFINIKSNFVKENNEEYQNNNQYQYQQSNSSNNNNKKKNSQQFYSPLYTAYLSLGLNKFATNEEIKKAYRQLAIKYHPDKLTNKSESEIMVASRKFREVTEAYDIIKKERDMK